MTYFTCLYFVNYCCFLVLRSFRYTYSSRCSAVAGWSCKNNEDLPAPLSRCRGVFERAHERRQAHAVYDSVSRCSFCAKLRVGWRPRLGIYVSCGRWAKPSRHPCKVQTKDRVFDVLRRRKRLVSCVVYNVFCVFVPFTGCWYLHLLRCSVRRVYSLFIQDTRAVCRLD